MMVAEEPQVSGVEVVNQHTEEEFQHEFLTSFVCDTLTSEDD
jgi:hypothetical protein